MPSSRTRLFGGTALLLVAAALTACSEGNPGPTSPLSPSFDAQLDVTPVPFASTSVLWDFAAIIPGTDDPEDLGTSETISLAGNGSIVATSGGPNQHITVKGRSLPVGATERGLGLCLLTNLGVVCRGDEVGDGGPGTLYLDFDGVEPAGSRLDQIDLGSLQVNEGYRYSISTDGGVTFGAPMEAYDGDADSNASVAIDLPTAGLVIKLEKATDIPNNGDNDYTVKSVTTSFTTDESLEGRMTGGGVKAVGDEGEVVTLGLTLHCDILLSNNLEVNWNGHQWHLAKPIVTAACSNIDNDAPPPASPIDTFEGTAYGRLDGVGDSFVEFRFQDHGEPGKDDTIELTIYEPGSMSDVALHITAQKLSVGNFQMHYDQPHKNNP